MGRANGQLQPTAPVAPPGSDSVFIADGYGKQHDPALKIADGNLRRQMWGGLGNEHGTQLPARNLLRPRKNLHPDRRPAKRPGIFHRKGYTAPSRCRKSPAPCNAEPGAITPRAGLDGPCSSSIKTTTYFHHRSRENCLVHRISTPPRTPSARNRRHRRLHLEPRPPWLLETPPRRGELSDWPWTRPRIQAKRRDWVPVWVAIPLPIFCQFGAI